MLHYILQTVAFQIFFLIIYDLFLKKETFFNWNRAYLLGTALLSVLLPFLKFESFRAIVPEPMVVRLPEVIIGEVSSDLNYGTEMMPAVQISDQAMSVSWTHVWMVGMVLMAAILAYKIVKLYKLYYKNPQRWEGEALIVYLLNSNAAFSFFHYIFLGTEIESDKKEHIVQHELVHVKERHSIDLLIFEVLRIAFWFNPMVYLYQSRVSTLHEFIADAKAVKYKGKSAYYQSLLSQVFETQHISFINPFFKQSLIKKRIAMLSKSKSKQIHLFKYALLIPMVTGMLLYTSSYASVIKESIPFLEEEKFNQELTFQELVDKYYKEIDNLYDKNKFFIEAYKLYGKAGDRYIKSKDEVAKNQAFWNYMFTKMNNKKQDEGNFTEVDDAQFKRSINRFKTYEDYLAYKKTDEAKRSWENGARDGELRLFVENIGNLTDAEQKRKDEKLDLIKKDDFYYKLTLVDGTSSIISDFGKKGADVTKNNMESQDIEVPYAVIEEVPLFEGCEPSGSKDVDKTCTSDKVAQFVNENFNVDLANTLGLKGRQRISVIFKIGKDGKVREVRSRASHPDLEAEAIRVIKAMPDFTPGKQRGKAVTVPYSLPILFEINENLKDDVASRKSNQKNPENQEKNIEAVEVHEKSSEDLLEVPYAVIEEAPYILSCISLEAAVDRKKCTSDEISQFVNNNFNTKLANDLGLKGMQRITVIFKIGKDGSITDIRSRAPHPELEKEAIRVIGLLPKMKPGKQRGKAVVVPYSLPIIFQVNETAPKTKN